VKSRREPERQLLVLVWAPPPVTADEPSMAEPPEGEVPAPAETPSTPAAEPPLMAVGDEASGSSVGLRGTKRWIYEFMRHHPDADAREVWESRPDEAVDIALKTVQNLVSEYRKLPELSRKFPKSFRER